MDKHLLVRRAAASILTVVKPHVSRIRGTIFAARLGYSQQVVRVGSAFRRRLWPVRLRGQNNASDCSRNDYGLPRRGGL